MMDVGISLLLFPKLLHRVPGANPVIALYAFTLEVRGPVHTVSGAEQGHSEFLVGQCAQSPAILFLSLDSAVRKICDEKLIFDLSSDAIGFLDSKRAPSVRNAILSRCPQEG